METWIQYLALFGIVTTYDIANYLDELFPKHCISIYDSDKTTIAVIRWSPRAVIEPRWFLE